MTLLDQLDHHSPSKSNMWAGAPAFCIMRYFMGVKDDTAPAMARGSAVETGLDQILHGQQPQMALAAAIDSFMQNMQGEVNNDIEAELKLIPGMVEQCGKWVPPSPVMAKQLKIEHWFDGLQKPTVGYLDFTFECGTIIDLKSTKACPSKPKPEHIRQVALYSKARDNAPVGLLYVTDKKHAYYKLDQDAIDAGLNELHANALSLERFLSKFDTAEDAIRCLPVDRSDFRCSEAIKQKLEELNL